MQRSRRSKRFPHYLSLTVLITIIALTFYLNYTSLKQSTNHSPLPVPQTLLPAPPPQPPATLKSTIAYAVSVTSCPNADMYQGASVLAHSIKLAHSQSTLHPHYKLYVFLHSKATLNPGNCEKFFASLNYDVKVVPTPIEISQVSDSNLREKLPTNGCCGERELIKFYAYTLTEHDVVVHLDLDTLVRRQMDDLLSRIKNGESDAFYTFDYNMVNPGKQPGVQGGFLVLRPEKKVFDDINQIVLTETFR